ncbi:MAG: serine--tRNA ligase, partial [Nanoarchaeota archaeon]|nr:serine--tRNA ligase [Nanoarchaeota archaeon]
MIDIKDLRARSQDYKVNARKKGRDETIVDEVLDLDLKWRAIKLKADNLRSERNQVSEAINAAKKSKDESAAVKLIKKAKEIPAKLKALEEEEGVAREFLNKKISEIPNIMSKRVPLGESEKNNKVEKVYGKPPKFSFPVKSHVEIAEDLGMADFDDSA